MPGHITTAATPGHPAVHKDRPDFSPPAALPATATPVELTTWRLEMDMHFDYTMASKALATAILDSVGASNQAALKVAFHPKPLHFLTPQEMVDEMLRRHAALTGPDLQKLRAPLHEPLVAIAELERHMTSFQLATLKLSETGHGEDAYRYFEWFKDTVKGFPLVATVMAGYYAQHPLIVQQNIATLFAYLTPQCTHLIELTGTAPFSGGALTPAPKGLTPNLNRRKKQKGKNQGKATWGNWQSSATPGHFAGAGFQAQTPPTFLGSDREAEYVAEIQQLRTMLAAPSTANVFSLQQHAYAAQSGSSVQRPRSHYCVGKQGERVRLL
jgi:hypothetical protein